MSSNCDAFNNPAVTVHPAPTPTEVAPVASILAHVPTGLNAALSRGHFTPPSVGRHILVCAEPRPVALDVAELHELEEAHERRVGGDRRVL